MSDDEYLDALTQLLILAPTVLEIDLEGLIERTRGSDALALVDPALWTQGSEYLCALRELAESALRFKLTSVSFRNTMHRLHARKDGVR